MLPKTFMPVKIEVGDIPDLRDPIVNKVLVLVLGAGVARIGVLMAVLFSRRVFGVAGESKSLRARTPLYGGDMASPLTLDRNNLGFLGLDI